MRTRRERTDASSQFCYNLRAQSKEPLDLLIVMLMQFCLYIFGLALIFRRFALIFSGLLFLTFLEREKREHSREALQQSCFAHAIFSNNVHDAGLPALSERSSRCSDPKALTFSTVSELKVVSRLMWSQRHLVLPVREGVFPERRTKRIRKVSP